ncbi:tRNA (guanosine(37)-N1)-methyltransferase TrmD [bacterium]|nr:tRNA (guanosine(37)-N1)-methyltransferase TrmD [bacterium]
MVHLQILTVYPEIFTSFLSQGLIQKAIEQEKLLVDLINFRNFGIGKHMKVDAPPYGGGAGMVLRPEPIVNALERCQEKANSGRVHKILISPQGEPYNQRKAQELSKLDRPIVLVCGRFEGFDERIREFVDEELSLGDYIMMGGEIAAMAIIESVGRLIPGVIGNIQSIESESFNYDLLEYSQYTRPVSFRGKRIPEVLTSGNHKEIENWRHQNALEKTRKKRPDLFDQYILSKAGV